MDLTAAIIAIAVAFIAATPPLVATVVSNKKTRRENEDQHSSSRDALVALEERVGGLHDTVTLVDGKVDTIGERVAVVEHHVLGNPSTIKTVIHNHPEKQ